MTRKRREMKRGSRGGKKREKRKMNWPKLGEGDCRLLLPEGLDLGQGEETLIVIDHLHDEMIEIGIGGMIVIVIDDLTLIQGIVIVIVSLMIDEEMIEISEVEIQGIDPVWLQDQGYVHFCPDKTFS